MGGPGAIKASFGQVKGGEHVYDSRAAVRSAPSVPSKYETVLYTNMTKEKNAFGSRTNRFQATENQLPGPGSYYDDLNKVTKFGPREESVGKKGYGVGFASKTFKFSDAPSPLFIVPGPGTYSNNSFVELRSQTSFNSADCSRIFASKKGVPKVNNRRDVPGPGHYETEKAAPSDFARTREAHPLLTQPKGAQSVFTSTTDRVLEDKLVRLKQSNPAPGHYEVSSSPTQRNSRGAVAAFKSSALRQYEIEREVMRSAHKKSVDDQTTRDLETTAKRKGIAREPLTEAGKAKPTPKLGAGSLGNQVPGPGSYESDFRPRYGENIKGDHMFSKTIVDRFGHVQEPRVQRHGAPGPGSYETVHLTQEEKHLISSSYFMSNTIRGDFVPGDRPPGPAYYQPQSTSKKDYHLNALQRWM